MSVIKAGTILVAMSALIATACTSGNDDQSPDASPTSDPVVITLGTGDPHGRPDTPVVEGFADAVEELSDGGIQVEVVWEAAGPSERRAGFELGVVELVRNGDLDLGWVAARVWDTVGVKSFQALQAPFLITDQELLTEVLASPMADQMIAGLEGADAVGLGMYPDGLRYPLGYAAPMASLEDYDGAAIRAAPSEATETLVRAFGGKPVYGLNGDALDAAITSGELDGTDISLGLAPIIAQDVAPRSVITGNVVLFPRVNTLFAGEELMASLSEAQREILVAAADEAYAYAASAISEDFGAFCEAGGKVAIASDAEVAALQRAALPVYRTLEADPQTKTFIDAIQKLKEQQPPADVPSLCSAG